MHVPRRGLHREHRRRAALPFPKVFERDLPDDPLYRRSVD
jgi:hypothetical protein